jgi:hypothetical protein
MALNFSPDGQQVAFLYNPDATLHRRDEIAHEGEEMLDGLAEMNQIA